MNTEIINQPDNNIVQFFPVSETNVCSNCSNELPTQDNGCRTSFGLRLCDDCLYS